MGMESGAWSLCSIIVGWIGTNALAGHQIMLTISQLFFQFYVAFASAVSIRVSHFNGQHDYASVQRTAWAGCFLNFAIAIIVAIPVIIFRQELGFLFTDSPEVAAEVSAAIFPLVVYQFSDGFQCTYSNAMRGLAYVKPVMRLSFLILWCPCPWPTSSASCSIGASWACGSHFLSGSPLPVCCTTIII